MPRTVRDVDEPSEPAPSTTNAAPFTIALVVVSFLVVVAIVFLREGDTEQGLFPEEVDSVDDETVRATVVLDGCRVLERAQVDYDDERVYVEFVSVPSDDAGCETLPEREALVEVELPRPIEDREVVPGFGRFQLPCSDQRCAEDG
jgi:hypothetical protein